MANFFKNMGLALGLVASALTGTASAQTFSGPPDVLPYVPVAQTYDDTASTPNGFRDPVADPPSAVGLTTAPSTEPGNFRTTGAQCLTVADGGTCTEAKFRTHANVTKVLYDDPIRNWGLPGTSHCHIFFGNKNINAFSTHLSLRTNNSSFAAGADANATGYWMPCLKKGNDVVKPRVVVIYYSQNPVKGKQVAITPPGFRYILGWDMDEPDGTRSDTLVAAANAAAGTNRYRQDASGAAEWRSPVNYACTAAGADFENSGSSVGKYFARIDGSDPWNGTCTAGSTIQIQVSGPSCWDGTNLHSDSGYEHVSYEIRDVANSEGTCGNWYRIPHVQLSVTMGHNGPADYTAWRLDSDHHAEMVVGEPIPHGTSFHTDWMDGWDEATFRSWQQFCIGAENSVPHECNDSAFSDTQSLIVTNQAPNGRFPQVEISNTYTSADPEGVFTIGDGTNNSGPATLHVHGE